jgi:hypothetical protein
VNPTRPVVLLRAEGGVLMVGALWGYRAAAGNWLPFVLLLFVPDLSMLGYLAGPRVGAAIYNVAHTAVLPAVLIAVGLLISHDAPMWIGLIWLVHIGFDRALGYGFKEPTGFTETHLGPIGRRQSRHAEGL